MIVEKNSTTEIILNTIRTLGHLRAVQYFIQLLRDAVPASGLTQGFIFRAESTRLTGFSALLPPMEGKALSLKREGNNLEWRWILSNEDFRRLASKYDLKKWKSFSGGRSHLGNASIVTDGIPTIGADLIEAWHRGCAAYFPSTENAKPIETTDLESKKLTEIMMKIIENPSLLSTYAGLTAVEQIQAAVNTGVAKNVADDLDFHFQQLDTLYHSFLVYDTSSILSILVEEVLPKLKYTSGSYFKTQDFLNSFANQPDVNAFLNLIVQMAAYIDDRAYNKVLLNQYEDKRTLARPMTPMSDAIRMWIQKKIDPAALPEKHIYRSCMRYVEDPMSHTTIMSEKHKAKIALWLWGRPYDESAFFPAIQSWFRNHITYRVADPRNESHYWGSLLYHSSIKSSWEMIPETSPTVVAEPDEQNYHSMHKHPLNQILYGPPGTGKTYTTLERAVRIAAPDFHPKGDTPKEIRASYRDEYNRLRESGQIEFTTFHQSLSYEDFVEGLKPLKPEVGDEFVKYDVVPGIFKRIAATAQYMPDARTEVFSIPDAEFAQAQFYKMSLGRAGDAEDESIYQWCITNGYVALGWGADIDFTGMTEAQIRAAAKDEGLDSFDGDAIKRFIHWVQAGDYVLISAGNFWCRAIGRVTGTYEFKAESPIRYHHFRRVEWLVKDVEIPVEELYGKVFSQMSIYQLDRAALKKEFFVKPAAALPSVHAGARIKNHVLIIDEINRGNVSQIFGDLITLLEDGKRTGQSEALSVMLPYSRETFSVPPNLYIVGTMNTADRSVEALDAALRRRFTFEEMMPDYEALQNEDGTAPTVDGISIRGLLETINDRITWLKDRDHQIGHSYLIGVQNKEDLRTVFRTAIVPLLQEYFFNDLAGIQAVLGSGFVRTSKVPSFPAGIRPAGTSEKGLELVPLDDTFDIIGALKLTMGAAVEEIQAQS